MLEVLLPTVPGFDTVVMNDRFKCAFITHSDYYSFGSVDRMKYLYYCQVERLC